MTRVSVSVSSVSDESDVVARHREHVRDFPERFEDSYDPSTAREESSDRPGEYVFVFKYVDSVNANVDKYAVSIGVDVRGLDVSNLVQPALEIGRTVGCSPYENDFVPPEIPDKWRGITWVAPPFPPFRPSSPE